MTKAEAKKLYDELDEAQGEFNSAWNSVAQVLVDEHAELQEKFDKLSEKAQEGERGTKLNEQIEELSLAEDLDADNHPDCDAVNEVLYLLRKKAGLS